VGSNGNGATGDDGAQLRRALSACEDDALAQHRALLACREELGHCEARAAAIEADNETLRAVLMRQLVGEAWELMVAPEGADGTPVTIRNDHLAAVVQAALGCPCKAARERIRREGGQGDLGCRACARRSLCQALAAAGLI
jgi:hypothetical protein